MKKIYLASPYSHENEDVRISRFESANKMAGELMLKGYVVFSPISHSHPIALTMDAERVCDHGLWMKQDLPFLEWADEVWVMGSMPQVLGSRGVTAELKKAKELGKPIKWIR